MQSKASDLLYKGKDLTGNDFEKSIETLKLANSICEALSLFSNKQEISFKINKNLAKLYLKMKKKKEAIKRIKKCYEVDRDAYVVSNFNYFQALVFGVGACFKAWLHEYGS